MLKIKVFGCKTNRYYTDEWVQSSYMQEKHGVFIASCVVTDKAKNKWVKFLKKSIQELEKGEYIYLSGCGVLRNGKIDEDFYKVYPELIEYREKIILLEEDPNEQGIQQSEKKVTQSLQEKLEQIKLKSSMNQHLTRKHLIIQNGCDNFCTFCLTVQARGRHHSRPEDAILDEIRKYTDGGGKEVVLTGTNLGAWGATNSNKIEESRLCDLLDEILGKTEIERLRISSLGVEFCSDRLIGYFSLPRISAYAHLSVQSGSQEILESMGRHYSRERLLTVLKGLNSIERSDGVQVCVGADLIVGFPGESEEDFKDTLELVREDGVHHVHGFPFSAHLEHYSIPANKFPNQIEEKIKTRRLSELLLRGEDIKKAFNNKHIGKKLRILCEGKTKNNFFEGRSQNYILCSYENTRVLSKEIPQKGIFIDGEYLGGDISEKTSEDI